MVSSWLPLWPGVIQEPIWPYCGRRPLVLACRPGAMARGRSAGMVLDHGKGRRGSLGLRAGPVRLPAALEQQVGQRVGLIAVSVEPGSPAERGGLGFGDVIVAVARTLVRSPDDVAAQLQS